MKYNLLIVPLLFVFGCQQGFNWNMDSDNSPESAVEQKQKGHDWLVLNTGSESLHSSQLYDLFFWTDARGVTVGSTGVFLTLDGGLNWERLLIDKEIKVGADVVNVSWRSIYMSSPDTIYLFGYAGQGTSKQFFLYKSSNLGQNWVREYYSRLKYRDRIALATKVLKQFGEEKTVTSADDSQMKMADTIIEGMGSSLRIEMCDVNSMILLGGMGQSFISTDVGKSWKLIPWHDDFVPTDISFPGDFISNGETTGYAVGSGFAGGVALKTLDGGITWFSLELPAVTAALNCCSFVTSEKGFVAGEEGMIYYTADGGLTWSDCSLFCGDTISDIIITQNGTGWVSISDKNAPGRGSIYFTQDFGQSWGSELGGYKYISRLYSDHPRKIVGVGHVPNSKSDLVVIYEETPGKDFMLARSEMKDLGGNDPTIAEELQQEVLTPVTKSPISGLSEEFEVKTYQQK